MTKLSYISSIKSVHIVRNDDHSIIIGCEGSNYIWRDNRGVRGSGEGYAGLHRLCEAVGDLSKEEYAYLVKSKV